jgi:gamma-D-glutamyl-L-lysine dipeptidyl-peptidase
MPVRSDPSHKAEQTTQMLFGEKAEILEIDKKEWARIHCARDGYEGWCKQSQLKTIPKKDYKKAVKYLSANNHGHLVMDDGETWLPLGSELTYLKGGKINPFNGVGKFKGKKLAVDDAQLNCDQLKKAAFQYLNAPYQWGGRTMAGIDCSGLTQMAFRLCNHPIPRDAAKQALEGTLVDFLQNAQCGDLAFFDNKDGNIIHVGLLLSNETIIHATDTAGRVVIDKIDQGGIISRALKMRTHNLRVVKRMF